MKIVNKITVCGDCPFFGNSMDGMECRHPYWSDKPAYDNMIITQDNVKGIPEECPLRIDSVTIKVKLHV